MWNVFSVHFVYFRLDLKPMHVFIAFTGFLLVLYSLLILYYHWIWDHISSGKNRHTRIQSLPEAGIITGTEKSYSPGIKVSIIIPARNEALHIGNCLQSIFNQSYPRENTEVIVVNDFSTDETASIVAKMQGRVRLLNLFDFVGGKSLNAYKKKALETGIAHASGELIVCTDADCTAEPGWIECLVRAFAAGGYVILAAPVKILTNGSALSVFQALDFASLQGITGAAIYKNLYPMCNGANLAYSRTAFKAVDGFKDIDHIASGDDMLLMGKMQAQFPGKAVYLKDPEAVVSTAAADSLRSFLQQRIRWASKISHYRHPATFVTLALVYALNVCLLLLFCLSFYYKTWRWLVLFLALKVLAEFFFVSKVAAFFRQQHLMKYFIFCQPFHIVYTVIAGASGIFGKYEWKSRVVK